MRANPFTNTINISARVMMENTDLDIKYMKLPPGMQAGYQFKDPPKQPRAAILLPKIDITRLDEKQRTLVSALCTHETKHHHWSDQKAYDRLKDDLTTKTLANWLEDARIELIKEKTFIGAEQDLDKFNANDFTKNSDEYNRLSTQNRWAWLFSSFFYKLRNIGNLPIPDEMKKYDEIAWEIINDGRFEESIKNGKKGGMIVVVLAEEIIKAFQEKRDEEYEDQQKENKENENQPRDKKDQSSSDPENESSGENEEKSDGSSQQNNQKGDSQSDKNEDSTDSNQSDGKEDQEDNQEDKQNGEGNSMSDADRNPDGTNPENNSSKDLGKTLDRDNEKSNDNAHTDAGEDQKPDDGLETGESSQDRPKSIREEFEAAQNDDETKMTLDHLQKLVADLQDNKDIIVSFIDKKDNRDPLGDYDNIESKFDGDPYIPYTACDKERIPSKKPVAFRQIEQSISNRTSILRRQLSTVLLARSQTVVERGHRKGQMDSHQYYKILNGSNRVKKQVTPGITLDTAVTLLIDLSGSMMGRKAALAVQVATLFGEALKNFKQIPFEILGYNSEELNSENCDKAKNNGYTRNIESINYWIFKTFEEPWRLIRERMGATAHSLEEGGTTGGCNCDHENLIHAAARLWNRKEQQKVLIVLCDGAPSGFNGTYGGYLVKGLYESIEKIRKSGIKLFCFGIRAREVERFYKPDVEIVNELDDLNEKVLRKLAQFLLHK
jgi:cobalamin biosynthesis protein CobT